MTLSYPSTIGATDFFVDFTLRPLPLRPLWPLFKMTLRPLVKTLRLLVEKTARGRSVFLRGAEAFEKGPKGLGEGKR